MVGARRPVGHAGEFGPESYRSWRGTSLGTITDELERRLIFRLAGPLQGRAALDVGCGDGALARALGRGGATPVVGCDLDPGMITQAAGSTGGRETPVSYLLARAEMLPFRDASFDLVTSITVLAFVPEAAQALGELSRVLRPGGRLVLGDLGKWSQWAASRRIRGWLGNEMWQAATFRSARQMRSLVRAAGLRVDRTAGAIFAPRCAPIARLMAPIDASLGDMTTLGAAFIAVRATKV